MPSIRPCHKLESGSPTTRSESRGTVENATRQPSPDSLRPRRTLRRISSRVLIQRMLTLFLAIPITTICGVAVAILFDLTQIIMWRGILEATEPRGTAVPVLDQTRYWIRHRGWACSIGYWHSPKSVIALCQRIWFTTPSAFMIVVVMVYALCGAWIFSLILRYRARRVGLHNLVETPDSRWIPTSKESARLLGHALLCQATVVIYIMAATAVALELFFSVVSLAITMPKEFGLRQGSWLQTQVVNSSVRSHEVPRLYLWLFFVLGILYSIVLCDRLACRAVTSEHRRTVRHCKRCGYPIDRALHICPECGPFVQRPLGRTVNNFVRWSIRPPSRLLLKITAVILCSALAVLAIQQSNRWVRVTAAPARPLSAATEDIPFRLSPSQMWMDFDYVAQLQLDTQYVMHIDGALLHLLISSHDNRSIELVWSIDDGSLQSTSFPAGNPAEPPGDIHAQWARIPVLFINDNALHFSIGDYILFDQGPRRVDVRIFADSVSVNLSEEIP